MDGADPASEVDWIRVDGVLDVAGAERLASRCVAIAGDLVDVRPGDKPHGATVRLTALDERLPEVADVVDRLAPAFDEVIAGPWTISEVAFRSPGPGTGEQDLHVDELPRMDRSAPVLGATAIVALVDVTAENGATRVVPGSHLRPDLQRRSQLVRHLDGEIHLEGAAGTAFVFSVHLLHAGSLNRSSAPRPVLQISARRAGAGLTPRPNGHTG